MRRLRRRLLVEALQLFSAQRRPNTKKGTLKLMFRDLRYSLRSLLKRPGFTLIVVATLALGIGVNAALFSVFNILLRPLPVRQPESIVRLFFEEGSSRSDSFSFPHYSYIRDHNQSFSDVLAVFAEERFLLGENRPNSDPEDILGNFVSDNYFTRLCTKSLKFHPRQWVVIFKCFLPESYIAALNPTNGSWWIVQVLCQRGFEVSTHCRGWD